MKVKWLLEKDVFEDIGKLEESLRSRGIEFKTIPYIPFEQDKYIKKSFDNDSCVISRGSINFIKKLQREAPWIPGSYANFDAFRCSNYYRHFLEYLLNRDHFFVPFGLLCKMKDVVFGDMEDVFIRPDSGDKAFTGKVVTRDNIEKEIEMERTCYSVPDDCMILVSSVVHDIKAEYRFIVADNAVLTGSQYRLDGKFQVDDGFDQKAKEYLEDILKNVDYRPDRVFTADIAKIEENKYSLIELNSFSSCGLYSCDPEMIVDEINRIAEEDYMETM